MERRGLDWEKQGVPWGAAWRPLKELQVQRLGSQTCLPAKAPCQPAPTRRDTGESGVNGLLEKYLGVC